MEISYTLDETDFLNHQLYLASKSERVKKNRLKRRIWMVVLFLSLAWLFYLKNDSVLFWYFMVAALLAGLFYPLYLRGLYKRHYQKHIRETYAGKIEKQIVLRLDDERLSHKDELSEGSMSFSSLTEIVEVPAAVYLRMAVGESLILPKNKLANAAELRNKLKSVAEQYHIPYREELDWQWK